MTNEEIAIFAGFGSIMTILLVTAMVGNIICFRMTHTLLKSKVSLVLVLNLNISDILVAMVTWGAFTGQHVATTLNVSIHLLVHKMVSSVLITLGNVTIVTLFGLAADCFLALRFPLHYNEIVTLKSVKIFLLTCWATSIFFGGADFIVATSYKTSYMDGIHETFIHVQGKSTGEILSSSITMLLSNILSALCLIVMVMIYAFILYKIKKLRDDERLTKNGGLLSEIHAIRTTMIILASFLLLWLPTLVINIISLTNSRFLSRLTFQESSVVGYTADCLLLVHSTVDAIIYGMRVRQSLCRQRRTRLMFKDYSSKKTGQENTISSASYRSVSQDTQIVYTIGGVKGERAALRLAELTELSQLETTQTRLSPIEEMSETVVDAPVIEHSELFDNSFKERSAEITSTNQDASAQRAGELDTDSIDEGIAVHSSSSDDSLGVGQSPSHGPIVLISCSSYNFSARPWTKHRTHSAVSAAGHSNNNRCSEQDKTVKHPSRVSQNLELVQLPCHPGGLVLSKGYANNCCQHKSTRL